MATNAVNHIVAVTSVTGNTITMVGNTLTAVATDLAISGIKCTLLVVGDIHGLVHIPLADPNTMEGILTPQELQNVQIELTEAGAGARIGLIAEELYP